MDNIFCSLNEAKESIPYGCELVFRYENKDYVITRLSADYIILSYVDGSNEKVFTSLEELLDHKINGIMFWKLIMSAEILYRNL